MQVNPFKLGGMLLGLTALNSFTVVQEGEVARAVKIHSNISKLLDTD